MDYKIIKLYVRNSGGNVEWATRQSATHWTRIAVYLTDLSSTEFDGPYGIEDNTFDKEAFEGYWELIQRDWVCGDAFNWAKVY